MRITDEMIEAAALSDAEFDGRNFVCMGRVDRDRYMLRAKASLTAALSASPAGVGVETSLLNDALPLLDHLSRETKTDHIGDDWLTQRAVRARKLATSIRAALPKEATHD